MKPLRLAALVMVCVLFAAGCAPAATPAPAPPTPLPPPTPVPPTPAPDLVAPVKAWADGLNKGNVDAALAPLADDVTWLGGVWSASVSEKERVRPVFDYLVGVETMFHVKDCQPQDNRAVCGLSMVDGCIAAFSAADGLAGKPEFVYQPDGRVREISLTLDDPRLQDCIRFAHDRNAWALVNRNEEYAKLNYNSREGGSIDLRLCEEYAASLKVTPTPVADPVATVKAWIDALNKGDVDAALALFTEDASGPGFLGAGNKDELRLSSQYLVDRGSKFGTPDCAPGGGGLVCSFTWLEGCIAAFGATDGLGMKGTFDIQPDGKIRKANLMKDGAEWAEYALWENKFEAWARANHEDLWIKRERLEFAPEYVKLCQEYAESLKAAATPAADLVAPVKAWADALNKGDVEAALGPIADGVWWTGSYQDNAGGKEQLQSLFDYLVGVGTKHRISECRQQADRVTCTVSITDGCIAAFGAPDGLPAELEFKFGPDGKIVESSFTADDPRWSDRADFAGAVMTWVTANRAEDWANLMNLEAGKEVGALAVKLCQEYAETLK